MAQQRWTVGDIERILFKAFPAYDAESWDRCGLQFGDRNALVTKIACALNPSLDILAQTKKSGANLLLTHHPPCIAQPFPLSTLDSEASAAAARFYEGIRLGLNLISMHTNLDRSQAGREALARSLGFQVSKAYEQRYLPGKESWGRLGSLVELKKEMTLADIVRVCKEKAKSPVQVFGKPEQRCSTLMCLGGSVNDFVEDARRRGVDVVISGECQYHEATDVSEEGLGVILLGHDVSEIMLVDVIEEALISRGVDAQLIVKLDENISWWK